MNKLQQLIKEYLYEQLYECECILKSDTAKNFTKVTDNLRGVCGITVVTVIVPAQSERGRTVETSRVRVKFFQIEPTMKEQLARMQIDAKKIDGVVSFLPVKWNKVVSRIYRPQKDN